MKTLHVHKSTYFTTKLVLLFFISLWFITAKAQMITIRGIVSVHNSRFNTGERKYIENATVADNFSRDRAQDVLTRSDGSFALIYAKGVKESETCEFSVEKLDYEVVNITDLKAVAGQKDTVRISMALKGDMAKFRSEFYKIGKTESEKNLEKQLTAKNQQLATLQKDQSKNEKRIEQLTSEIRDLNDRSENIDAQVLNIIKTYASINLDDESPLIGRSIDYFRRGLLDSALQLVNQSASAANVASLKQTQKEIAQSKTELITKELRNNQQMANVGQALMLEADIFKTRFQIDSATECYNRLMYLDSTNPEYLKVYALHLAWLNQTDKAIRYYQQALRIYESNDRNLGLKNAEIANLLNNLGMAYLQNLNYSQAEVALKKALAMRDVLTKQNASDYQPLLAESYSNLGALYTLSFRLQEAEEAYNKAAALYVLLKKKNSELYNEALARVQTSLGELYRRLKKYPESEAILLKALALWNTLNRDSTGLHESYLAKVKINLGYTCLNNNNFKKAGDFFLQALEHNTHLAKSNPLTYQSELAYSQLALGDYYKRNINYPLAENYLLKALKTYKQLPDTRMYRLQLVQTQCSLGDLYRLRNELPKSKAYLENTYAEYLQLEKEEAGVYRWQKIDIEKILGDLYISLNEFPKAETILLNAQTSILTAPKTNGLNNEVELVSVQSKLSDLYFSWNMLDKSILMSKNAVNTYRKLAATDKKTYEPKLAAALINLGDSYNSKKDTIGAEKVLAEAVHICNFFYQDDPQAYGPDYAAAQINTGDLYRLKMQYKNAETAYAKAVTIYKELAAGDSVSFTLKVAEVLTFLGNACLQARDFAEAETAFSKVYQIHMDELITNPKTDMQSAGIAAIQLLQAMDKPTNNMQSASDLNDRERRQSEIEDTLLHRLAIKSAAVKQNLLAYYLDKADNLLLNGKFVVAEQTARKALLVDTGSTAAQNCIAQSMLLQGNYNEAQQLYTKLKLEKSETGKSVAALCIVSLEKLKARKMTNEYVDKMIAFLKQ